MGTSDHMYPIPEGLINDRMGFFELGHSLEVKLEGFCVIIVATNRQIR